MMSRDDGDNDEETSRKGAIPAVAFPKCGIRVSYLLGEFVQDVCGGRSAIEGWTTAQVCEEIILPQTAEAQCSFCEILAEKGHPAYGRVASAFISHAHCYNFLDVLSALGHHLGRSLGMNKDDGYDNDDGDVIIWFDMFSINQHLTMNWTFDWLSGTFRSAIAEFGRTIMILTPWDDPVPFTRAWCIFEGFCTAVSSDCRFEIALSSKDRSKFVEDMTQSNDAESKINQMLTRIRSDNSQCSVPEDKEKIFKVIRQTTGFSKIDAMLFEQYRGWVIQVSLETLENCKDNDREYVALLDLVATLYHSQGKYSEAEEYRQLSISLYLQVFGNESSEYLLAMSKLVTLYIKQGRYDEAEDLLRDCLDKQKEVLGEDHPHTLDSMTNLASLYDEREEFHRARPLYEVVLQKTRANLGDKHDKTISAMNNLAVVYFNKEKYSRAQGLFEQCLSSRRNLLGVDHPSTLQSMSNVAAVYDNLGMLQQARSLWEECLSRRSALLGGDHPDTLNSMHNLADLHSSLGNMDEAISLYDTCMKKRRLVLGKTHPDTLMSTARLALLYYKSGNVDLAQALASSSM